MFNRQCLGRVPINAQIAAFAEFGHKSPGLSKKQQLTGLFCERDARNGYGQAAMAKYHSRVEVATKLAQANDLARQGKLQSEIARTLGISVITLHRWRRAASQSAQGHDTLAELQLENSRLRRVVTDLLLETIKLKDAAQGPKIFDARGRRRASLVLIKKRPDGGKD